MRGVHKIVPVTNGIGVIADNTWRAMQAADAIVANWARPPTRPIWTPIGRP